MANTQIMPSFAGATGWLNSEPLTPVDLRGRVVLVDFWTYTCINWLRTLPYIRAWHDKYATAGLAVIGVHTPEFPFEMDIDNVRRAVGDMAITYPVATDNDYAVWRAFDNHYWPAIYVADVDGRIQYHHFGEGEYAQTEMVLQRLLAEAGAAGVASDLVEVGGSGAEAPADWASLQSPETYIGYLRTGNFASPDPPVPDEPRRYTPPDRLGLNQWAPSGDWTLRSGAARLNEANGRIAYRFHARDLHLVMGPAPSRPNVRFRVLIDGEPPGAAHGADVDERGNGTASDKRLYQLIRQPPPVADHQFEIEFLDPDVEAYVFTFG